MPTRYRKAASEEAQAIPTRRQVKSYPELRMAAEIAGVSYWMAYKVRVGKAQSEKVQLALSVACERMRVEKANTARVARKQLRALRAEKEKLQRVKSEKVDFKAVRDRLRAEKAEEKKVAREKLRALRSQEKKLQRMLGKGKAA